MYVFTCVYILVWPGSGVNHMSKSPSQCLCLHPLWAQVYYALKNVDKATPGHLEVIEPGALPCRFWMVLHLDCVTGGIGLVGTIWMQCFSAASTLEITSATAAWSASLFGLHGCFECACFFKDVTMPKVSCSYFPNTHGTVAKTWSNFSSTCCPWSSSYDIVSHCFANSWRKGFKKAVFVRGLVERASKPGEGHAGSWPASTRSRAGFDLSGPWPKGIDDTLPTLYFFLLGPVAGTWHRLCIEHAVELTQH